MQAENARRAGPSPRAWGLQGGRAQPNGVGRAIPTCVGTTPRRFSPARRGPGHPHVRGDYLSAALKACRAYGPSPRVWGLRHEHQDRAREHRAIPTCVGTTMVMVDMTRCDVGSSPRVWGLLVGNPQPRAGHRAIPTCVGTTVSPSRGAVRFTGPSPRVWGLRVGFPLPVPTYRGPSPRAWGLLGLPNGLLAGPRAIPTCVGTTPTGRPERGTTSGHPHVCGDYGMDPEEINFESGPSPRAWGLQGAGVAAYRLPRAIPTCVGTTSPGQGWGRGPTGHPHVRGDYNDPNTPLDIATGPSPRAWGLLLLFPRLLLPRRAIPTCVGTTRCCGCQAWPLAGHPHVRGDYLFSPGCHIATSGPSPRAWGLPNLGRVVGPSGGPSPRAWGLQAGQGRSGADHRAIPTCVGTTPKESFSRYRPTGHPHVRGDYNAPQTAWPGPPGPSPRAWGLRLESWNTGRWGSGHPHVRGDYSPIGLVVGGVARAIPTCVGTTHHAADIPAFGSGHPHVRGDY